MVTSYTSREASSRFYDFVDIVPHYLDYIVVMFFINRFDKFHCMKRVTTGMTLFVTTVSRKAMFQSAKCIVLSFILKLVLNGQAEMSISTSCYTYEDLFILGMVTLGI